MQIDWLTVIAQMANFLILMLLLKRFLYRPVIEAMDNREQLIASRLEKAGLRESDAIDTIHSYNHKIAALESDRELLMEKARKDTEIKRLELLKTARREIADKRIGWQRQVALEKHNFLIALKQMAVQSVQIIARRAIKDMADTDLENQIIEMFIKQLKSLDGPGLDVIAQTDALVEIKTAFKIEQATRSRLIQIVKNCLGEQHEVVFAEAPDIMCGIELTSDGRRLSWTLTHYLDELEQRMQGHLEMQNVTS